MLHYGMSKRIGSTSREDGGCVVCGALAVALTVVGMWVLGGAYKALALETRSEGWPWRGVMMVTVGLFTYLHALGCSWTVLSLLALVYCTVEGLAAVAVRRADDGQPPRSALVVGGVCAAPLVAALVRWACNNLRREAWCRTWAYSFGNYQSLPWGGAVFEWWSYLLYALAATLGYSLGARVLGSEAGRVERRGGGVR